MPAPISMNDLIRAKLPFWRTIRNAFILTFGNLGTLAGLLATPLMLLVPLALAYNWYLFPTIQKAIANPEAIGPGDVGDIATMSLLNVAMMMVACSVLSPSAVGWQRFLLRQEQPDGLPALSPRVRQYALTYVGLSLVMMTPGTLQQLFAGNPQAATPGMAFGILLLGVLGLAAIILFYRLSLVLPAIAVDNPDTSFGGALQASRGHTLRMFFGNMFCVLPVVLPIGAMYFLLIKDLDRLPGTILLTLSTVAGYVVLAVGWTFMALAYRHFYELTRPGEV